MSESQEPQPTEKKGPGRPKLTEEELKQRKLKRAEKAREVYAKTLSFGDKGFNYDLQFARAVPEGPYKTQAEKYEAVAKFQDFQNLAMSANVKMPVEQTVTRHMHMRWSEIQKIKKNKDYLEMRLAWAKIGLGDSIENMGPIIKKLLEQTTIVSINGSRRATIPS